MANFFNKIFDKISNFFKAKKQARQYRKMSKKTGIASENGVFSIVYKVVVLIVLIAYAVAMFYLLYWMIINSFKGSNQFTYDPMGLPSLKAIEAYYQQTAGKYYEVTVPFYFQQHHEAVRFGNFSTVINKLVIDKDVGYFTLFSDQAVRASTNGPVGFWGLTGNTLFYSVVTSILQVFVSYSVAYLTAKYRFKFSTIIYMFAVIIMGIPIIGSQTSMITTLQNFGLYSNYLGMIMMRASYGGMYYLVFVAFFEGLPDSYVEAAEVDGASQLAIFIRIIMPLGVKTILTVTLILAVGNWNDYTMSFIYMPTIPTLSYSIYSIVHNRAGASGASEDVHKMAGCMLTCLPLLVLFIFAKDKIMGNVSAGGLKG